MERAGDVEDAEDQQNLWHHEDAEGREEAVHELRAGQEKADQERDGDRTEAHQDDVADDADDLEQALEDRVLERLREGVIIGEEGEDGQGTQPARRIILDDRLRLRHRHVKAAQDEKAQLIDDEALHGTSEGDRNDQDALQEIRRQHLLEDIHLCSTLGGRTGTGDFLSRVECLRHDRLHLEDVLIERRARDDREEDDIDQLRGDREQHHEEEGPGHILLIVDTAAEDHADEGHAGRVDERRRQTEEHGHQRGRDPYREARAETVTRAIGDHRDRQDEDERPLKHGAGLAVDQEQDRKERGDHRTERDFLSFLVQYVYLDSEFS